jgi:peptidoglycan hydrolase-like protein with peptidoglycan-binding domain
MDFSLTNNQSFPDIGTLQVNVFSQNNYNPIPNATVIIQNTQTQESNVAEELDTDSSGQTETISLKTPPLEYSLTPESSMPYGEYNITVSAPGYETTILTGAQILPDVKAIQDIRLVPLPGTEETLSQDIDIDPHTLYAEYPPKIPEAEIKTVADTGEIILSQVVIPEYIIVHDGLPDDNTAPNYYVTYKDYIKNVACSEIYATWPESSIYANILAIMSFTLNRVYTEWYRNRFKNFTITSSTAYDQKWIYGRNIYSNIDYLVDSVFANYLSRPGIQQPILASYCDGVRVTCSGLSQWGSKNLGEEGYDAIDILRYYYGNDIYINTTQAISGVPSSFPGYDLTVGSSGQKVYQLQEQLGRISRNFPAIPRINADGIYGQRTADAVRAFQSIFDLPSTGITDYPTWYTISDIYVGVTRIAEPI